jgi:glycopeptide antibiotics resistance protein
MKFLRVFKFQFPNFEWNYFLTFFIIFYFIYIIFFVFFPLSLLLSGSNEVAYFANVKRAASGTRGPG